MQIALRSTHRICPNCSRPVLKRTYTNHLARCDIGQANPHFIALPRPQLRLPALLQALRILLPPLTVSGFFLYLTVIYPLVLMFLQTCTETVQQPVLNSFARSLQVIKIATALVTSLSAFWAQLFGRASNGAQFSFSSLKDTLIGKGIYVPSN